LATLTTQNVQPWWSLADSAFDGSMESCGWFCVGAFSVSFDVKMVSHFNFVYKEMLYLTACRLLLH